ncbi:MAG TPA: GDSL-type esterase/lipase family protein [Candidatus Cloacimonadota bacterium]|nr:GDSL-type esterase/lipase family protein [Candidatus Cloacimonadota bacterium]
MKKITLLLVMLMSFCIMLFGTESKPKKIIVFGSSVASGWISSLNEQYDMQNGWAFRLERFLENKGFQVINKSVPGDNTDSALKRFEKAVIKENPDILIISLSLSNEGLGSKPDKEVIDNFMNNLNKMIEKAEANQIKVIIGSCYANNEFSKEDFEVIKKTNIQLQSLNKPVINLLGNFSDLNGHFPENHSFDGLHPDNFGHEEMFLGIVPGLFNQLLNHKTTLNKFIPSDFEKIVKSKPFYFVPESIMHSFCLHLKTKKLKHLKFDLSHTKGELEITIEPKNLMILSKDEQGKKEIILSKLKIKTDFNSITYDYNYANRIFHIYLNDTIIAEFPIEAEPLMLSLSTDKSYMAKDLLLYRTSLLPYEIQLLNNNQLYHAGLEVYLKNISDKEQLALSNSSFTNDIIIANERKNKLAAEINQYNQKRSSMPVFKDKTAIDMTEEKLAGFVGSYLNDQVGEILIAFKEGKLLLNVMGNQAQIFPESENIFFMKHPAKITLEYSENKDQVKLSAFGQEFVGKKK